MVGMIALRRGRASGSNYMGETADWNRAGVPPMPTTTTHCSPSVPLPTGVAAAGSWQPKDPLPYRVVLGEDRGVTDHNMVVHTVAIQFADGRIKAATVYSGRGLSSTQARELAAALLEAADQLDGWIEPSC